MKWTEDKNKTGITTMGATGLLITAGVIFGDLSTWWLLLGGLFITSGIGLESK